MNNLEKELLATIHTQSEVIQKLTRIMGNAQYIGSELCIKRQVGTLILSEVMNVNLDEMMMHIHELLNSPFFHPINEFDATPNTLNHELIIAGKE